MGKIDDIENYIKGLLLVIFDCGDSYDGKVLFKGFEFYVGCFELSDVIFFDDGYEGKYWWDLLVIWIFEEEKVVVCKIDIWLFFWFCVMFFGF